MHLPLSRLWSRKVVLLMPPPPPVVVVANPSPGFIQQLCSSKGISNSGNKKELVARLPELGTIEQKKLLLQGISQSNSTDICKELFVRHESFTPRYEYTKISMALAIGRVAENEDCRVRTFEQLPSTCWRYLNLSGLKLRHTIQHPSQISISSI
jgi:hypothetical protein